MAIACSTSAFKLPLDEALAEVARLGFAHVDVITMTGGWDHINPNALVDDFDAQAERVESLLTGLRLTPVAFNVAVGSLHEREAEKVALRRKQIDAVARLARRLGVKVASFYPGHRDPKAPPAPVPAETIQSIAEILDLGRKHDVTFVVEPHYATTVQTVDNALQLLEALPDLGVAYDPSHYAMQEVPLPATEAILARALHVHVRDAGPGKMHAPCGTGTVDFDWLLGALAERNYQGHISIEVLPGLGDAVGEEILALRDRLTAK